MNTTPFDCKAQLATLEDVDAIIAFYEQHRTPAVYLRKRKEIEQSIRENLFVLVKNTEGQIIAASGVYLLNDGKELEDCIVHNSESQRGKVAELGSVLRWEEGLPEDKRFEGLWHPFLFGVPMILLFDSIRLKGEPSVDILVCDVQSNLRSNKQRLMGHVDLTPLKWTLVNPGKDLEAAFRQTVRADDINVDAEKDFFMGWVGNLPDVAKYLLKCAKFGLTNRKGESLSIDMSSLIERWTTGLEGGRRYTLLGQLIKNAPAIRKVRVGWREFARTLNDIAPLKGDLLNGMYSVGNGSNGIDLARAEITARPTALTSPVPPATKRAGPPSPPNRKAAAV